MLLNSMIYNQIILVSSSFSTLGSLVILFLYITMKEVRIPSYRLVMYLQMGNLLQAISRIMFILNSKIANKTLCQVVETTLAIGDIQALMWTLLYSIQTNLILRCIIKDQKPEFLFSSNQVEGLVILGSLIPTAIIIALYSSSQQACVDLQTNIYDEYDMGRYSINLTYVVLFLSIITLNMIMLCGISQVKNEYLQKNFKILKLRIVIFTVVFFVCNIGYIVEIFYHFLSPSSIPISLIYVSNFFLSLWGFLNACTTSLTPLLIRQVGFRFGRRFKNESSIDAGTKPSKNSVFSLTLQLSENVNNQDKDKSSIVRRPTMMSSLASDSESSWLSEL